MRVFQPRIFNGKKMKAYVFIFFLVSIFFESTFAQSDLDLFANYHTIGVNVHLKPGDPEKDAYGILEYKESSYGIWQSGFPLSRVENELNMCSGCVFWCKPKVSYDIRVTMRDSSSQNIDGQVLLGTVKTRSLPQASDSGDIIRVSESGGKGTVTLEAAFDLAEAGDRIMVDSGRYFVGSLALTNNGDANNPIQIIGNGAVIFDGANKEDLTWTPYGNGGVYFTNTAVTNPNLVIADGIRLYPHQTYPDLQGNKVTLTYFPLREYDIEMPGFYRNPTLLPIFPTNFGDPQNLSIEKLYVKFLDQSDPNGKDIVVSQQSRCITLESKNNIVFRNITFRHYGVGSVATALIISNSNDIIIDSCRFEGNNTSIRLDNKSDRITIQNSFFRDYHKNWHAWIMKSTYDEGLFTQRFPFGSRILEKGSIVCNRNFYGRGTVVRNNRFENYQQVGTLAPSPAEASVWDTLVSTLELDFYDNIIENASGDGFEIDGISRNVRVFDNIFKNVHAPLSMAISEDGPVYILRNTFSNIPEDYFDDGNSLSLDKGQTLKFQFGSSDNSIRNGEIFFFHNTVDAQNSAYAMNIFQINLNDGWRKLESRNNILKTDEGIALNVRTLSPPIFNSDFNAYFSENNDKLACINFDNTNPDCYDSISVVFDIYGFDENSIQVNPLFVDESTANYQLTGSSPFIDQGVIIYGINDLAFNGNAPDIGAYEYSGPVSVTEDIEKQEIRIYPNPSSGVLTVKQQSDFITGSYQLFDLHGHLLRSADLTKNGSIEFEDLPIGIYFLQVNFNGDFKTFKVLKNQ